MMDKNSIGFEFEGWRLGNYAELLKYFGELGFQLSLMEKIALKENLDYAWHRKFHFETQGYVNGSKYSAIFKIVRPKYENYFAIREYQFTLQTGNEKAARIFDVGYCDSFHPDKLKDPITKHAAYNLICGRAVFLDDMGKWIQLDFTHSDEAGNFRIRCDSEDDRFKLEEAISKLPIKELDDAESKARLLESLRNGNLQSVIYNVNGVDERKYIEVSPHFKILNIYDVYMRRELMHQDGVAQRILKEGEQKNLQPKEQDLQSKGRKNGKHSI
ncbi:MAG: hypothetical protein DCE86_00240 [Flavobacteriaceae bacterium]|nr:MAG: hypothetical protein DCE86_00240 [Flavobacteriaceae bacterium]